MVNMNPFDLRAVLLAKHAQHVVLIHFPIALFIAGVAFDLLAQWKKDPKLANAAYFNLLLAAISTVPVLVSGILAWRFQLEGQPLKGILRGHLILGLTSTLLIWAVWRFHQKARRHGSTPPSICTAVEIVAVAVVGLTGHLGGFLSGVNGY